MITTLLAPLVVASFGGNYAPITTSPQERVAAQEPGPAQEAEAPQEPKIPECTGPEVLLPSGLKYCVLNDGGDGPHPGMGDTVRVDYTGWLQDGTSFDSSRKSRRPGAEPQPAEFALGAVIDGWNEMLQIMSPGDKVLVTIPFALAYGAEGRPPSIPPKSDLTFEIELHAIVYDAPDYEEWNPEAEDIITLDSGVALRVIAPGKGDSVADGATATMDATCWTQTGKFAFVHSLVRQQRAVSAWRQFQSDSAPLPFMRELAPYAKAGARLQVLVPSTVGLDAKFPQEVLPDGGNEVWMINYPYARKYEKPEFRMPTEEELTTTESGLKYMVVSEGTGRHPTADNTVVAHYNGWLPDGTQFDSSFDRGAAIDFPLRGVVPGWTEGIPLAKEGGSIILVIPSELGYGERGTQGIPGGSTLVFYVDLLAVQ